MIANYHTHTWRCQHASGTEEEYVLSAIQAGIRILGFSDHAPYPFPDDYVSPIRMLPSQLEGYCDCIGSLRNQYADSIEIHIGLEAEYYPAYFSDFSRMLEDSRVEYLILGQHFIGNEPSDLYSGRPTEDESILKSYCHQAMEGLQTGKFTYMAHPDLINYIGNIKIYRQHMVELVRMIRNCGMPAEINLLGMLEGKHYPGTEYLKICAEENCPVILACDAHNPSHLLPSSHLEQALRLVREYGLDLQDTVALRGIC